MPDNKVNIVNGMVVGQFLGKPLQDAQAAKAEDNEAYARENNTIVYTKVNEEVLEKQPEPMGGGGAYFEGDTIKPDALPDGYASTSNDTRKLGYKLVGTPTDFEIYITAESGETKIDKDYEDLLITDDGSVLRVGDPISLRAFRNATLNASGSMSVSEQYDLLVENKFITNEYAMIPELIVITYVDDVVDPITGVTYWTPGVYFYLAIPEFTMEWTENKITPFSEELKYGEKWDIQEQFYQDGSVVYLPDITFDEAWSMSDNQLTNTATMGGVPFTSVTKYPTRSLGDTILFYNHVLSPNSDETVSEDKYTYVWTRRKFYEASIKG